jgi:hypothetical protein
VAYTPDSDFIFTAVGEYTPSQNFQFAVQSYIPPSGSSVVLNFGDAYTAPSGASVILEFAPPSTNTLLGVTLSDQADFGSVVVGRRVVTHGWDAALFGTPFTYIAGVLQTIYPEGTSFGSFGYGHVYIPENQYVDLVNRSIIGFASGTAEVYNRTRYLTNVGGLSTSAYGTAVVESTIRTVDLSTHQINPPTPGTPTVWFSIRYVTPPSVWPYTYDWEQTGRFGKVEYATRTFALDGWDSLQFGTAGVARNEVVVYPPSIEGEAGQPDVQLLTRYVTPQTIENFTEWGSTWVSQSPRYVYPEGLDTPIVVGIPWGVENGNKTVTNYGWSSSRFGSGTYVYNNARVLEQHGYDHAEYGTAFVSAAIRTLNPAGWESSTVFRWTEIYNYAQVIAPSGIPRLYAGVPYVWSNTQWIDLFGSNNLHIRWGDQFVAHGVRTVSLDKQPGALLSNGIPPPDFNVPLTHYVGLFRQLTVAEGIPPLGIGGHVFEVKFTIFKPWGPQTDEWGTPSVQNVTPEIKAWPWIEFEPSTKHYVGLYTRTVSVSGQSIPPALEFLPRPHVEFRTKTLPIVGFDASLISRLHDVRIDEPQIPAPQTVVPAGYSTEETSTNNSNVGRPVLRGNRVSPDDWESSRFGTVEVHIQGCSPLWDWPDSVFGIPFIPHAQEIKNATVQPVVVNGVGPGNPEASGEADPTPLIQWGKPRISPHTVWCRLDTPQQAVDNHPESHTFLELDDVSNPINYPGGLIVPIRTPDVQWGRPLVTCKSNRVLYHYHNVLAGDSTMGEVVSEDLELQLKNRRLYLDGIPPKRAGIPDIPSISFVYIGDENFTLWGKPEVTLGYVEPFTRTIYPEGTNFFASDKQFVELFNRTIYPVGSRMDVYGNNQPMIHFPRVVSNMGGTDFLDWGTARVEYKIRQIYPVGFDSFECDYTPMYFNQRMRVRKKNPPVQASLGDTSSFGKTEVTLKIQAMRPYQIPAPRCFGRATITG